MSPTVETIEVFERFNKVFVGTVAFMKGFLPVFSIFLLNFLFTVLRQRERLGYFTQHHHSLKILSRF